MVNSARKKDSCWKGDREDAEWGLRSRGWTLCLWLCVLAGGGRGGGHAHFQWEVRVHLAKINGPDLNFFIPQVHLAGPLRAGPEHFGGLRPALDGERGRNGLVSGLDRPPVS